MASSLQHIDLRGTGFCLEASNAVLGLQLDSHGFQTVGKLINIASVLLGSALAQFGRPQHCGDRTCYVLLPKLAAASDRSERSTRSESCRSASHAGASRGLLSLVICEHMRKLPELTKLKNLQTLQNVRHTPWAAYR
jgi:hypothetical protein